MKMKDKGEERRKFLANLDQARDIPTFLSILNKLNEMLGNDETSIRKIGDVMEYDQAIAAKLLRLVNSAFYGLKAKICSIHHALVILGINSIRNAIISISVFESFGGDNDSEVKHLWEHSVSTAINAKILAIKTRKAVTDDAFAAGLLHDIGKVILVKNFKEDFKSVMKNSQNKGISFFEAEKETVPMNHCQIGAFLAEKWQFPKKLTDVIENHHSLAAKSLDPELVQIVQLADAAAHCGEDLSKISDHFPCPQMEVPEFLKLEILPIVLAPARVEAEAACRFFFEEDREAGLQISIV